MVEPTTQKELATSPELPGKVNSISFSRDGKTFVAASGVVGLYGEADAHGVACAAVVTFEGDRTPTEAGWSIDQVWCDPLRWVESGFYSQHVELCEGHPPPGGQTDAYRRDLEDFVGVPGFFLEWVVQTDAPRTEIPWGGGAVIALGSFGGVNYTFFISRDQAKLNRDNALPIIFVDLAPDVPHTFRLELSGADSYVWLIDGQVVDSGVPEGAFPCCPPRVSWRAKAAWVPHTTHWDYIRFGTIPPGEPGDTNCDGAVNVFDIDPFLLALLDPDGYSQQFPACIHDTADLNGDELVNFFDIDPFACIVLGCP